VILRDQRAVLTVCSPADEVQGVRDVTVSLPRLVGGSGVLASLPLRLGEGEGERLAASARTVRDAIGQLPVTT
jgi:L-lactate dehydrogenase